MTTLVALNTMEGLVLGSDSLGTATRDLVDPLDLMDFFEFDADEEKFTGLKYGPDGQPILTFKQLFSKSQTIPYNHMTLVDKLISFAPLDMGVMFAGISSIGDRTIKSIVEEFRDTDSAFQQAGDDYTVAGVSRRLMATLREHYVAQFPSYYKPSLELIVGGYDKGRQRPCIVRLDVEEDELQEPDYDFAVYFGAQGDEIQRLVFGTDLDNKIRLIERNRDLFERYRQSLTGYLSSNNIEIELPEPDDLEDDFRFFTDDWDLEGLDAPWGAFSIQNAIECVDFLVTIMIRSHQFKAQLPSVGGPAQIGVIQKNRGFVYVSERVWRHGDNVTQIDRREET